MRLWLTGSLMSHRREAEEEELEGLKDYSGPSGRSVKIVEKTLTMMMTGVASTEECSLPSES